MCKNSDLKSRCAARSSVLLKINELWWVSSRWCIFTSLPVGKRLVGNCCYNFFFFVATVALVATVNVYKLCFMNQMLCLDDCQVFLPWKHERTKREEPRCLQLIESPLNHFALEISASLQHEGFSTQAQTKQNKPIKRGRTRRPSKLAVECGLKWAVGVRDVRLFSSVCRWDKTGGGFVLNQASLSCSVMGTLPKKCPVISEHGC